MCDLNTAGSLWLADFSCKEEKEEVLHDMEFYSQQDYSWDNYSSCIIKYSESEPFDDALKKAYKVSVIQYCLESGFARDVMTEEEAGKCAESFRQKQYNFKLFNKLLAKFCCYLCHLSSFGGAYSDMVEASERVNNLLTTDIRRYSAKFREEEVEKGYVPLKKQIEEIASGVKGRCYLAGENYKYRDSGDKDRKRINQRFQNDIHIDEELNNSIIKRYGYDFNSIHPGYNREGFTRLNSTFCNILLNDNTFWSKHEKFDIIHFIEAVKDFNGQTHAEKILFYIFDEIKNRNYGEEFISKSITLDIFDYNLVRDFLEKRTKGIFFSRYDKSCSQIENENFCYPLSKVENVETKIEEGRLLAIEFFREIYPNDFQKVIDFIDSGLKSNKTVTKRATMAELLDGAYADLENKYRKAIEVFCPDYFSMENIWNRFFLKLYALNKITGDNQTFCARAFVNFYYLIDIFNEQLDLKTAYQHDTQRRDSAFNKIKELLARYGINPSEKFKENYIISLLDEKVALVTESMKFPVLEQLGDAIYGFAVAENLFYNLYKAPYIDDVNLAQEFENFIRAEAQIAISHKIGLTELFISPTSLQKSQDKHKYLADMLEMTIGSVCIEFGYEKAIEFVKQILKETYPDKFIKEVRWFDDISEEEDEKYKIQPLYWTIMRPAIYSEMEDSHRVLWRALNKLVLALSIGTEEKFAREYITYEGSVRKAEEYGDKRFSHSWINKSFYEYFQNGKKGLTTVLENYSAIIKEHYEKVKTDYLG